MLNISEWTPLIQRWLAEQGAEIERMYRELHQLAEIGWQEHRTTAYICERLSEIGLEVRTFAEHTGAIGSWRGKSAGRSVALRADMDALWQAINGQWRANHSCGHDAHMTMVFIAVRCLKEIGYQFAAGELLTIFQPAEETAEGAKALLQTGMLDHIDCMLGIHLRPQRELANGLASAGIYHGGAAKVYGRIQGRQAHAARPEDGINALETLAAIVTALKAIRSDQKNGGSCKVTTARVPNESDNVIPDEAEFIVDIRASSYAELEQLTERVRLTAITIGEADGAEVIVNPVIKAAPAIPSADMEQVVSEAIVEVLGENGLSSPVITPGAEDFHFYSTERRELQATMIGLGCGLTPGLHHPEMSFDHGAMSTGAAIMAVAAIKLLEDGQQR